MSVIEVDALNADKIFRLMFNNLSSENKAVYTKDNKNLTNEEIRKIVNQNSPDLDKVIEDLNRITSSSDILNRKVKLSVNKDINRIIIKIVEKDTDRVIKEIPCKELQQLAAHLKKAIGILYDDNA